MSEAVTGGLAPVGAESERIVNHPRGRGEQASY